MVDAPVSGTGERKLLEVRVFSWAPSSAFIPKKVPYMNIHFHQNDLPNDLNLGPLVAVDTEAMGLIPARDRLCMIQLSAGDGECHLVQISKDHDGVSPNLEALLTDPYVTKIFHFARFDVAAILNHFSIMTSPVYCTKIASKLVRTYADRHGLKDICKELLGIEVNKHEQLSDWGAETLTKEQLQYAATDVLHLHKLKEVLDGLLEREGRVELAEECFSYLSTRAYLDLTSGPDFDIFAH